MKTNQPKYERKQMVVDKPLQQALSQRIVVYWCATWLAVFTLPILARALTSEVSFSVLAAQIYSDFWFPIAISLFIMPIVVWDSLRFSNRIAGPVYRINNTIKECVSDQPVGRIVIRTNDFCGELAENVNDLIEKLDARDNKEANDEANEMVGV